MPKGKSPSDHVLAIVTAGISAVPIVGDPIAALITAYVPTATQRDIEKTLEILGQKLTALGDRVDIQTLDEDEFSELFKSCYLVMMRSHKEEKLQAAANILANLCLRSSDPAKPSYDELDHLVRCVESLSIGALSVLGAAIQLSKTVPVGLQLEVFPFEQLQRMFPQWDAALLMSLVTELRSLNLLRVQEPAIRMVDYEVPFWNRRQSGSDLLSGS
jgi:hypothetical protein